MDKISCYIIGSISAPIDRSITSWAVEVHVCVVVLDSARCGDQGEPTGWTAIGSQVIRDILMVSKVRKRIKVKSKSNQKMRIDLKVEMGRWGSVSGKEKYGS